MMFEACYFIGMNEGKKKKDGSYFGCLWFLYCNSQKFGQPDFKKLWFDSPDSLKKAVDGIPVGSAVIIRESIGGGEPELFVNDNFESIDFSPID